MKRNVIQCVGLFSLAVLILGLVGCNAHGALDSSYSDNATTVTATLQPTTASTTHQTTTRPQGWAKPYFTTTGTLPVSVYPSKLTKEDFHTDVVMRLDATEYGVNDRITGQLQNNTAERLYHNKRFHILEEKENGEQVMRSNPNIRYFMDTIINADETRSLSVDLTPFELEPGKHYTLIYRVGPKYAHADFRTKSE